MYSVSVCNFAAICSTIVHDGGVELYNLETAIQNDELLGKSSGLSLAFYLNTLKEVSRNNMRIELNKALSQVVTSSLSKIKNQTVESTTHGKNASSCYEAAKQNATTLGKQAFGEMEPCVKHYLEQTTALLENATKTVEGLEKFAVDVSQIIPQCQEKFKLPSEVISCVKENKADDSVYYIDLRNYILIEENSHDVMKKIEKENKGCFAAVSKILQTNLQEVEEASSRCISAL